MILLANEQNLVSLATRSKQERSEIGRKGAEATNRIKKEKKTMRQMLEMCLEMENAEGQSYMELATLGLLKGAMKGDSRNYRAILETLGELKVIEENRKVQQLNKVEELLQQIKEEANK